MRVIDGQLFRFPIEAQQGQKLRRTLANLIASETMNATYEGRELNRWWEPRAPSAF
jgi:hypothetical protein